MNELTAHQASSIKVFGGGGGGGGGVILPNEIDQLQAYGVTHIYSPEDGQKMGLKGMIEDVIKRCSEKPETPAIMEPITSIKDDWFTLAKTLTQIENDSLKPAKRKHLQKKAKANKDKAAILGITNGRTCTTFPDGL